MKKLVLTLAVVFGLTACVHNPATGKVDPVATSAQISFDVSNGVAAVQNLVIQANQTTRKNPDGTTSKVMSDASAVAVMSAMGKVNQVGLDVDKIIRSQATLAPNQKASIKTLLTPLVSALQDVINQNVVTIADPTTKNSIQVAIQALITAINTTIAAVSPTGGN